MDGLPPTSNTFEFLSELGIIGYILIISNFVYVLRKNIFKKKTFLSKVNFIFVSFFGTILPSGSFLRVMVLQYFGLIILFN